MKSKSSYQELLRKHYFPIFFQDYYLDAVCDGGSWSYVKGNNNDIWVYFIKKKWGLTYIISPQLTPYLGYWKYEGDDIEIVDINKLKDKLPAYHVFIDNLHPQYNIYNKKRYTYIISQKTTDEAYDALSRSCKRSIKKAQKTHQIIDGVDYSDFVECVNQSFVIKSKDNPFPMDILKRIEITLDSMRKRKIYGAINERGELTAVVYLIYDDKRAYNLVSANLYNDQAMYLLQWTAISWSMVTGRSYDFEGSMIPGVEEFFQRFGGAKTHYPYIYESKNKWIDKLVKIKNPDVQL